MQFPHGNSQGSNLVIFNTTSIQKYYNLLVQI